VKAVAVVRRAGKTTVESFMVAVCCLDGAVVKK
jgi:hypothetical protein